MTEPNRPYCLYRCETNYAITPYIAEFINTLSNIPFIALGLYGFYRCRQIGLPLRYQVLQLSLALIGVGSFGFHMTVSAASREIGGVRKLIRDACGECVYSYNGHGNYSMNYQWYVSLNSRVYIVVAS